jgi:transposase
MLDVKEISKKLNISKKTVYKYLKKYDDMLDPFISIGNNKQKILSEKGYILLLQLTEQQEPKQKKKNINSDINNNQEKYIQMLESNIRDLKKDKEDLKNDKDNLIKLLDQQQQLHLSLQNNIKLLEVNEDSQKQNDKVDEVLKEKNIFSTMKKFLWK